MVAHPRKSADAESYYAEKLSGEQLRRCYDVAPPRVQQYLQAEVDFVVERIRPGDTVLDLGCGYGRTIPQLAEKAKSVVGVDISSSSLALGRRLLARIPNSQLLRMDATALDFPDGSFEVVLCVQNGISAFKVDPVLLMRETIRVTRKNGTIFFSSYSEKFWEHRLEWFRKQAEEGLIGEIDEEQTGNGVIVCKDGFKATTYTPEQFIALARECGVEAKIFEVDDSAIFCVIEKE
jgi:ubiquinone/menaquinone biosynthesis C-methylase UbiE